MHKICNSRRATEFLTAKGNSELVSLTSSNQTVQSGKPRQRHDIWEMINQANLVLTATVCNSRETLVENERNIEWLNSLQNVRYTPFKHKDCLSFKVRCEKSPHKWKHIVTSVLCYENIQSGSGAAKKKHRVKLASRVSQAPWCIILHTHTRVNCMCSVTVHVCVCVEEGGGAQDNLMRLACLRCLSVRLLTLPLPLPPPPPPPPPPAL